MTGEGVNITGISREFKLVQLQTLTVILMADCLYRRLSRVGILIFFYELSFLLNDQKKRNKKKSPANILDYPLMA